MGEFIYNRCYSDNEIHKYSKKCKYHIPYYHYYSWFDQDSDEWPEFVYWCQTELKGIVYHPMIDPYFEAQWRFEFEEDAMAFKLRWL